MAESIRTGAATSPAATDGAAADRLGFLQGLHPEAIASGQLLGRLGWLDDCRNIIDVGGGSAGLALALHRHLPAARIRVLERADVAPLTRQFIATEGGDIEVVAGDVVAQAGELDTAMGTSCDGIVCCALLQVLAPDDAALAVRRMTRWLCPGGRLVVLGMGVLEDDRVRPRGAALANILFGSLYDDGRGYTVTEYRTWMQDAGLVQISSHWLEDGRGALIGNLAGKLQTSQ